MAVEKGKVRVELDKLFQGKSVSKELKDKYAARWAEKIENDEGIEAFVKDREDDVLDASKEADFRATEASKKARQEAADAAAGKTTEPKGEEPKDDPNMPEWAKLLVKSNEALAEKVQGYEQAKQAETIADRFAKDDRLKGIPKFILDKSIPKTEDDFEAAVTDLANNYSQFATENKLQSFGKDAPAAGATKQDGDVKQASDKELDAVMDKLS